MLIFTKIKMIDDYMLKVAGLAGAAAAKLLFNKDKDEFEKMDIEAMSGKDILALILKKLTLEGKYDKAEDILFEEIEKNPCEEIADIGKEFYNKLLLKSDEELAKGNFSRIEVLQGLGDLQSMVNKF